jgi:hypothetical protein
MYNSTFTELMQMLKETQKNWVVKLETDDIGSEKPWRAQLSYINGKVTTCRVWHKRDGRSLFTDGEAIRWLISLPQFTWTPEALTLQPQQALPQANSGTQALLSSPPRVPQRIRQTEQWVIRSWPLKQRHVFALVDGDRSVDKIAAMLRQPVEVVVEILHELEAMGVMTLE